MPDAPNHPATPSLKKNLRRTRRLPPKGSTRACVTRNTLGLGANIAVSILDLCENGIRLILKEDMPKGHEFEVTLESQSSRAVKVVARTIWSLPLGNGTFCVGTVFTKGLGYTDLSSLARS